jgi:hypothetical protein
MPVKGLLHDPLLEDPKAETPWWANIGPALSATGLFGRRLRKRGMYRSFSRRFDFAYDFFKYDIRLPATLPRELCGPGLPPRTRAEATTACLPNIYVALAHQASKFRIPDPWTFDISPVKDFITKNLGHIRETDLIVNRLGKMRGKLRLNGSRVFRTG